MTFDQARSSSPIEPQLVHPGNVCMYSVHTYVHIFVRNVIVEGRTSVETVCSPDLLRTSDYYLPTDTHCKNRELPRFV